jgi:NitT/TauT family transport system substrate-binding protein
MLALILAVLLASGLLSVAGCGSSSPETTVTAATTTSQATTSSSEPATTTTAAPAKLDKLTLVAPPGPMAIPMAYLKVNNRLAGVAAETDLVIWENPDQLKAIVAGKQGDFVTVPSNTAAIFYNKGLELQLLDISVWNITYLVTRDPAAADFTDIKGQSLVVPFQGSVPDVTFQYIAAKEGLDPLTDFDLRYATDPTQAAQLLVSGQVDNAVLSEALATAVLLQTKDAEKPLRKAFAFDKAWEAAAGPGATSPIAGTVATPNAAVDWMLANPEEAGLLVETELPDLGLKAPVMTAALKGITWKYTPALEAKPSLAAFYTALMELSPEVIGGKLPDDGFYYAP